MRPNVKHYSRLSPEPIEVTNAFELNGNLYAAVKYLSRAGYKDLESKDVQKAIDYLNFEVEYNTQRYDRYVGRNIDLSTLWTDCTYRNEIIQILQYVKARNSCKVFPYLGIVNTLTNKVYQLKKEGK